MQISFSTLACPDWSWSDIIANGRAYGYDGVEVRLLERETNLLARPEFQSSHLSARRRELNDAEFRISGLASSVRFDHAEAGDRHRDLATGRAYLDLAAELEAGFVRVFGDVIPDGKTPDESIPHIADGLQQLAEYAEALHLQVVLETHGDFAESALVERMMQDVSSSSAGILWDTHHPWRFFDEQVAESFSRMKPWIRQTHWKDSISRTAAAADDAVRDAAVQAHALMSGHRHADYVLFGGGEFPILDCLRLLRAAQFDGWFCYEWEKAWHPEIEPPEIALPLFPAKIRRFATVV